jgi:hypothetical protein
LGGELALAFGDLALAFGDLALAFGDLALAGSRLSAARRKSGAKAPRRLKPAPHFSLVQNVESQVTS